MVRWSPAGWGALAALATALVAPEAAAVDPRVDYHTLITPHFRVHYEQGRYADALDVARAAEIAHERLSLYLDWQPDGITHLVVRDQHDYIQGLAVNLPYRYVTVHPVAPTDDSSLADFDDPHYQLLTHELTHILHIDTIHGLPEAVNLVFGNLLSPNAAQPGWFIEGIAVHLETEITGHGRASSPYTEMVLRMAVLSGDVPGLALMGGSTWRWPQGSIEYFYGGYFVSYIAKRFGKEVLADISHDYASRIIPWAINLSVERATGFDYPTLYADFLTQLETRFSRQVGRIEHRGRIEGTPLTERGQEFSAPRVGSDGTIYFVEDPINDHAELKALGADGERAIGWVHGDAQLTLLPGGEAALIAQRETFEYYRSYRDLFRVDLDSGSTERLTRGARLRGPDVSADGERIVFAQVDGGRSVIRVARLDRLAEARTVADFGGTSNVWTPRFSPDGSRVVFAGNADLRRDLWEVTLGGDGGLEASGEPRRLTNNQALEGGPAFTADGRFLLYHSDRDGIYNLYAQPTDGGELKRITRVVGGAFHPAPTPDGAAVIYRTYGPEGFDLARIEIDDWEALPVVEPEPLTDYARHDAPAPDAERASVETYPSVPYSAFGSLLPTYWLPATGTDPEGSTIGISLVGEDVLGQHIYGLDVTFGIDSYFLAFDAVYYNRQFHPGFWIEAARYLTWGPTAYKRNEDSDSVQEEIWFAEVGTGIPLISLRDLSLKLYVYYDLTFRQNVEPFLFSVEDTGVVFPDEGRFTSLHLTLSLDTTQSYTDSISDEEGGSLSLTARFEHPYLGSEYEAISGTLKGTFFVENPLVDRHVLAMQARFGIGAASYKRRNLYTLSGMPQHDLVLRLLNQNLTGSGDLRGLQSTYYSGDLVVNGSVEYRLPIFDIHGGFETLPFFFRTLHGAVFFDAGAIADEFDDFDALGENEHYTLGVELRLDLTIGYVVGATIRFGWGHGLGADEGVENWFLLFGDEF